MNVAELQGYLHQRIPLSRAMAVEVVRADADCVVLQAPLAPNINHRETVFGGSAAAVATLAAWSVIQVGLESVAQAGRIVIRRSTVDFERPITAAFQATAAAPAAEEWRRMLAAVRKGRMGRVGVAATLTCDGERVGGFGGDFAVIPPVAA